MSMAGWTPDEMAARVAADIPEGWCVNLGIGLPTLVANHLPPDREILLHSENGIIGMGPRPQPGHEDPDLVDAGKAPVTLITGAAIVHHADSFALIRGGRLDVTVLGAMQVSEQGDLANWRIGNNPLASMGGAMDLCVGARRVFAMMYHIDKDGRPKILRQCTYALTAPRCVKRIYTNLAVIDVTPTGLEVREMAPGVTLAELQAVTEPPLRLAPALAGTAR